MAHGNQEGRARKRGEPGQGTGGNCTPGRVEGTKRNKPDTAHPAAVLTHWLPLVLASRLFLETPSS